MGGRNLYVGSFKKMNKLSAEVTAHGWPLAGLPVEWRILAVSAAICEVQNQQHEGEWKHSLMSYTV